VVTSRFLSYNLRKLHSANKSKGFIHKETNNKNHERAMPLPRKIKFERSSRECYSSGYIRFLSFYYYSCTNFHHKSRHCRAYCKSYQNPRRKLARRQDRAPNRYYNSISPSLKLNVECYQCHNVGNME